jgi:hypothetical protein
VTSLKRFIVFRHRIELIVAAGLVLILAALVLQPSLTSPIDSYAACVEAGYPVLDSEPPVCREGSRNFTGTPQPKPTAAPPISNINFEILVNADTGSAIPEHGQQFIKSPAAWEAYWRGVHGGLPTLPPLLPVDFSQNNVVGVSLGQKPTAGYNLKISSISSTSAGTVVSLTETTPTITCKVAYHFSNRYLIVRTPQLVEPVSFRVTSENRRC